MENKVSELEALIGEIKEKTKNQRSINKIDEVTVMKCMLNDPDFKLGVYDKKIGFVAEKCPRTEAVNFVKNIISGTTGLDNKDSKNLAENYEFTKRDAGFLVDNAKDFMRVYMSTGRKINIIQDEKTEAYLFTKDIKESSKVVPDKNNIGEKKTVKTEAFTKLYSSSKCPKYISTNR